MKLRTLMGLFIIFSITIMSCSDSDTALPIGSMEAKIDGTNWKALTRVTIHQDTIFNIMGTSANGDVLNIIILADTEGTYNLDVSITGLDAKISGFYKPTSGDNYIVKSGTVKLTDVNSGDKKISGTFDLEVSTIEGTTLQITDGKFSNLKYTDN